MKKLCLATILSLVPAIAVQAAVHYQSSADSALRARLVEDELILSVRSSQRIRTPAQLEAFVSRELGLGLSGIELTLILSRPESSPGLYRTLFKVTLGSAETLSRDWNDFINESSDLIDVLPNYEYEGEPREMVRFNDPLFQEQTHHAIMRNTWAWSFTLGSPNIVVAVTDDGVDIDHEDLRDNIWRNPNERKNGLDTDNNGYVDDIHGWDFSSNNNDPRPVMSLWGGDHGTHVAGIIAAAANNRRGVVGIAPKVQIMPIRFYGSGRWTSDVIARAYAYAVDNGAQIITTSYNVDQFVRDPLFREAIDYVYSSGLLHFNSAGNNASPNPPRQEFHELIFVCSTDVEGSMADKKSGFSNWGDDIDLCAPGADILSTVPSNRYDSMSGTSMSTPAAAAVAALIWSAHPHYTRDQVLARLMGSSDPIDEINPRFSQGLGAGRVNTLSSLLSIPRPARVSGFRKIVESNEDGEYLAAVELQIHQVLQRATVENPLNWQMIHAGFDGIFGTADDQIIPMSLEGDYKIGRRVLRFDVHPLLRFGRVRFIARAGGLKDPFNQALDGNGDGRAGGAFVYEFDLDLR